MARRGRLARGFPRLVETRDRFLRSRRGGAAARPRARGLPMDRRRGCAGAAGHRPEGKFADPARGGGPRAGATAFLARAVGRTRRSTYRGTAVRTYGDLAAAYLGDFLAIGRPANVRAAIDAYRSPRRSNAASRSGGRAHAADNDRSVLWLCDTGRVAPRAQRQPGVFGRLAKLADDPDLLGASVAARAEERRVARLRGSVALEARPCARPARPAVRPQLHEVVPGDAVAFLDMRGADQLFETVAEVAGDTRLPESLGGIGSELSGSRGAELRRALRPLFGREAALI